MKNIFIAISILSFAMFFSCKKDESVSCISCTSPDTLSFELCQEGDGNASVNGENTGISYDVYLTELQATGAQCNN